MQNQYLRISMEFKSTKESIIKQIKFYLPFFQNNMEKNN